MVENFGASAGDGISSGELLLNFSPSEEEARYVSWCWGNQKFFVVVASQATILVLITMALALMLLSEVGSGEFFRSYSFWVLCALYAAYLMLQTAAAGAYAVRMLRRTDLSCWACEVLSFPPIAALAMMVVFGFMSISGEKFEYKLMGSGGVFIFVSLELHAPKLEYVAKAHYPGMLLCSAALGVVVMFAGGATQAIVFVCSTALSMALSVLTLRWKEIARRTQYLALVRTGRAVLETKKHDRKLDRMIGCFVPREHEEALKSGIVRCAGGGLLVNEYFETMSILILDVVSFTKISASCDPEEVAEGLSQLYGEFDRIGLSVGMHNVKVIGDGYLSIMRIDGPSDERGVGASLCAGLRMARAASRVAIGGKTIFVRGGMLVGSGRLCVLLSGGKLTQEFYSGELHRLEQMQQNCGSGRVRIHGSLEGILQRVGPPSDLDVTRAGEFMDLALAGEADSPRLAAARPLRDQAPQARPTAGKSLLLEALACGATRRASAGGSERAKTICLMLIGALETELLLACIYIFYGAKYLALEWLAQNILMAFSVLAQVAALAAYSLAPWDSPGWLRFLLESAYIASFLLFSLCNPSVSYEVSAIGDFTCAFMFMALDFEMCDAVPHLCKHLAHFASLPLFMLAYFWWCIGDPGAFQVQVFASRFALMAVVCAGYSLIGASNRVLAVRAHRQKDFNDVCAELLRNRIAIKEVLLHSVLPGNLVDRVLEKDGVLSSVKNLSFRRTCSVSFVKFILGGKAEMISDGSIVRALSRTTKAVESACGQFGCQFVKAVNSTYISCAGMWDSAHGREDVSQRMIQMARGCLEEFRSSPSELNDLRIHAGVATGTVLVCLLGSDAELLRFDILGQTVNLASRLCDWIGSSSRFAILVPEELRQCALRSCGSSIRAEPSRKANLKNIGSIRVVELVPVRGEDVARPSCTLSLF